jgi:hypothetical protein
LELQYHIQLVLAALEEPKQQVSTTKELEAVFQALVDMLHTVELTVMEAVPILTGMYQMKL